MFVTVYMYVGRAVGLLAQPSLAELRPSGRARPDAVGLSGAVWCVWNYDFKMQSEKTRLGMTGLLSQPSSAKLRPMGRARPGTVGLSGGGGEKHAVVTRAQTDKVQTGRVQTKQQSSGHLFLACATECATPVGH